MQKFIQKTSKQTIIFLIILLVVFLYYTITSVFGGTTINKTITSNSELDNGLVGHWTFDGKDIDLASSTGEVINATGGVRADWKNHSTTTVPGKIGQALELDGVDDHVDIGNIGSGIKTISFWIYSDDITSRKIIDIDGIDQIELNASGDVQATSFPAATIYKDSVSGSTRLATSTWSHIVVTDTTGVNPSNFDVGAVSTSYFDGRIDDVRVYNRALSVEEVTRLYHMRR